MQNKRGISEVVTTILVLLLVLAAIVIIWTFVRPAIEKGAKGISASECLTLNLEPVSCAYVKATNVSTVQVRRNAGQANLAEISFVFKLANGDEVVRDSNATHNELETKTYSNLAALPSGPLSVKIAGKIGVEGSAPQACAAGKEFVCTGA